MRCLSEIHDSTDIEITGTGVFDGDGYNWWWSVFLTTADYRPHMLVMRRCMDVLIHVVEFKNSPQYHLFLNDMVDVVVR